MATGGVWWCRAHEQYEEMMPCSEVFGLTREDVERESRAKQFAPTADDLIDTRAGLALANGSFNEGVAAPLLRTEGVRGNGHLREATQPVLSAAAEDDEVRGLIQQPQRP